MLKGDEFVCLEEIGKNVKTTFGYRKGIALVQEWTQNSFVLRKILIAANIRNYKKQGFSDAGADFAPDSVNYIDLRERSFPGSRYFENAEQNRFFEILKEEKDILTVEGEIGGLGSISRSSIAQFPNPDAYVASRIQSCQSKGFVERPFGKSYSLKAVKKELEEREAAARKKDEERESLLEARRKGDAARARARGEYESLLGKGVWADLARQVREIEEYQAESPKVLLGRPEPDERLEIAATAGREDHAAYIMALYEYFYVTYVQAYNRNNGIEDPALVEELLSQLCEPAITAELYRKGQRELWAYYCAPGIEMGADKWIGDKAKWVFMRKPPAANGRAPGGYLTGYIVDKAARKVCGTIRGARFFLYDPPSAEVFAGRKNLSWVEGQPAESSLVAVGADASLDSKALAYKKHKKLVSALAEEYSRLRRGRLSDTMDDWPPCLGFLEPCPPAADGRLPECMRDAFVRNGIADESGMKLPVSVDAVLGRCPLWYFVTCPNLPEHHVPEFEIDADTLESDISSIDYGYATPYIWSDVSIVDKAGKATRIRLAYNAGSGDSNDGYWGGAWDRDSKRKIADIVSSGDMETTIKVAEDFKAGYSPHGSYLPLDIDTGAYESMLFGNVRYGADHEAERLIHCAMILCEARADAL